MAFTPVNFPAPPGARRRISGSMTGPASYTTGGNIPTPSDFGLTTIDFVSIASSVDGTSFGAWDRANGKILLFTADGTQAGNGTDQSAQVYAVTLWGV